MRYSDLFSGNNGEGAPVSSEDQKRFRHVRITRGQVACESCGQRACEVVLLERDRPLCVDCAGTQLDADIETVREWLRSLAKRVANRVEEFTAIAFAWR